MDDEQNVHSKTDQLAAILDNDAMMDVDEDVDIGEANVDVHVGHAPKKMKVTDIQVEGMCVECEDQPFSLKWYIITVFWSCRATQSVSRLASLVGLVMISEQCFDVFCEVCFQALHRKGQRKSHTSVKVENNSPAALAQAQRAAAAASASAPAQSSASSSDNHAQKYLGDDESDSDDSSDDDAEPRSSSLDAREQKFRQLTIQKPLQDMTPTELGAWYTDRARYIPLRLSLEERKLLRLVQAALNVSDYTDKVDIISYMSSKPKRMAAQLRVRFGFTPKNESPRRSSSGIPNCLCLTNRERDLCRFHLLSL
jgi:hypothetical protein